MLVVYAVRIIQPILKVYFKSFLLRSQSVWDKYSVFTVWCVSLIFKLSSNILPVYSFRQQSSNNATQGACYQVCSPFSLGIQTASSTFLGPWLHVVNTILYRSQSLSPHNGFWGFSSIRKSRKLHERMKWISEGHYHSNRDDLFIYVEKSPQVAQVSYM